VNKLPGLAAALAVLAFARLSPAALGPGYGGRLTVGVPRRALEARATAPWIASDAGDGVVGALVHEGLVRLGPEGFPLPALAARWTAAAGAREWTLEIDANARLHDESPVEADDAARSLRRFLRSRSAAALRLAESLDGGAAFRRGAAALPGVAAIDARRLTLRLRQPLAAPLAPLAAPAAAVTGPRGEGAGPFVPVLPVPGSRLALNAFGSHVRGRPLLDGLTLVAFPSPEERRAALREGRLDVAAGEPGQGRLTATLLLVLDPSRRPFDRLSRREAVAAALESETLAGLVPGAAPARGLLAPHVLSVEGAWPATRGTLGGSLSLTVASDVPPLVSQRIVASLAALGLRTTAAAVAPAAARTARAAAKLILWAPEVAEPGLALRELASLAPVPRLVGETLDAADAEIDLDRRRAWLVEADSMLRADRVLVPLALVPASFAARQGVQGVRLDAVGTLVLEDAWVQP
jgi:MarR-like DNA-binding transcriptional regulator SgrR of sgrS sRNA